MLNQVVLVGRLTKDIEMKKLESGKDVANITIAIPRSQKNAEGLYDTDFINIVLWDSIAKNTTEYCKKGDIIGVKGRIQTRNIEKENGEKVKVQEVIAEKVTFLSSKKADE